MRISALAAALALTCGAAAAQVQEIFSSHVRVLQPQGEFAQRLIKMRPAGGDGWRVLDDEKLGLRILVPDRAAIDTERAGSRLLQVELPGPGTLPRPIFRIDEFTPQPGEATSVDVDYAVEFAEQYSQRAFDGKFAVSDRGMVVLDGKHRFATVGGNYYTGAARAYRLQWSTLSKDRQLFVTFDCLDDHWPIYHEIVGRMLLSLNPGKPKKKGK